MIREKKMENLTELLTRDEKAVFTLRALYNKYGYSKYKMSKFEEYDLYSKNKDFLSSENIITFTDTDGRLLALKPDVTLSIIKNSRITDGLVKAQYNENVYRISKGTNSFKELMQIGLECLGDVGNAELTEVILLAAKSLDLISETNVLEISHLDITYGVLNFVGLSDDGKKKILDCLGKKNAAGIEVVCKNESIGEENTELVKKLATVYGTPNLVLNSLAEFKVNEETTAAVEQLEYIFAELKKQGISDKLCIDFSLVGDMKYYNGIAMKGFIDGIPSGILSGGQYDKMMLRMHKNARGVGFAVYLDDL
ncbi:MAG: hypothetical protein E7673_06530 [Ruminococcaceae bacterium]|nr:hypothetical protein [Oscillospiraceae bacterium]